ncbi:MAG: TlpA disulfide reductase family protein [Pseudomonadota bacterium]
MRQFLTPRLWIFVWGGIGALFVVYVMIASAVQSEGRPGAEADASDVGARRQAAALSASNSGDLLVGEMADFELAFPGKTAPDAVFQIDGTNGAEAVETNLDAFKGKTVLVNFWATWCAPCLRELPSLDALQGELGGEAFEVLAVAADPKGPDAAADFLEKLEIENLTLYADPKLRLATSIGGQAVLPISILYNANGDEVGRLVGEADWASDDAKRLIRAVIREGENS